MEVVPTPANAERADNVPEEIVSEAETLPVAASKTDFLRRACAAPA